jgi:menaquinone-dependent protoporphyrinogen oxidase
MNVLVVVASRHHATYEMGGRIASTLTAAGMTADLRRPEEIHALDGYDAVVLGSAVYAGQWLPAARAFAERLGPALRARPVWLFSSGPVGDPPAPAGDPAGVAAIAEIVRPRDQRVFAGRVSPDELRLGEKLVLRVVRAKTGDYRNCDAVDAWAREIALALEGERAAVAFG